MKVSLPRILTLVLLLAAPSFTIPALSQTVEPEWQESQQEDEEDFDVSRVARLSFIQGDVSFLRAGVTEWADAVENLPLLTGDQIYAGEEARAEIQLGRGNYIRLSEKTALTITELSETAAQFDLTEGIAIIRVERFSKIFERFEVDTPNAALVLEQDGLYRVNVQGKDYSEVIARRGSTEVSTLDGTFKVREGNRLLIDTSPDGRLEIVADISTDDWDRWSYDRDTVIDRATVAASPDYVNSYETDYNSFYGASELSSYGTWTDVSSYGYCWVPRVNTGWAPYRYGQWIWIPSAGWTWLSSEPWGWAPYHYGRWAFVNNLGWAWIPGFRSRYYNYNYRYYRWRPALVSFFNCPTPRGSYVGWYPLAPGERWRRPDREARRRDRSRLQYPTARDGRQRPRDGRAGRERAGDGVTILPVEGFTRPGRTRNRPEAPTRELRDWVSERAQPGLPELLPTQIETAAAPRRDGEQRRVRRTIKPPADVLTRPVVTRNRPADPAVATDVPRERRLITPRKEKRAEKRANRGLEDNGTGNPVVTIPSDRNPNEVTNRRERANRTPRLAMPDETTTIEPLPTPRREKRRERTETQTDSDPNQNNGSTQEVPRNIERSQPRLTPRTEPQQSEPSNDRPRENRERHREDKAAEPSRPRKGEQPQSNNDSSRSNEGRSRENKATENKPSPTERARPRNEERQQSNFNMPTKPRGEMNTPRPAMEIRRERPNPPPEMKQQIRQERRQERQQQRQERKQRKNN